MDEYTEPDKLRGNRRRFGTGAQNETISEIVNRKTQDKGPERVFVNTFLWRVVRMRAGKRLGQEHEGESSDETYYRRFSGEFQAFGEEIGERQSEKDSGCDGNEVRPSFLSPPCRAEPRGLLLKSLSRRSLPGGSASRI